MTASRLGAAKAHMSSQTMQASLRLVVSRPLALRRACVSHHCAACWKAKCGVSFIAVTPRPGSPCGQTCRQRQRGEARH